MDELRKLRIYYGLILICSCLVLIVAGQRDLATFTGLTVGLALLLFGAARDRKWPW
jgi:hypothetical protein